MILPVRLSSGYLRVQLGPQTTTMPCRRNGRAMLHTWQVLNKEGQLLGHVDGEDLYQATHTLFYGRWHDERDAPRTEPLKSREPVSLVLVA